jgi:hypothetical protein
MEQMEPASCVICAGAAKLQPPSIQGGLSCLVVVFVASSTEEPLAALPRLPNPPQWEPLKRTDPHNKEPLPKIMMLTTGDDSVILRDAMWRASM